MQVSGASYFSLYDFGVGSGGAGCSGRIGQSSLTAPGAHRFGKTNWPARTFLIPLSRVRYRHVYHTTSGFSYTY